MIKKKNVLIRWICSLMPGAGEMYMGFMKMGISMMALFLGTIAIFGMLLGMDEFTMLLCTLEWIYSFFHVHNLAGMDNVDFYAVEDEFIFFNSSFMQLKDASKKFEKVIGWLLVLLGGILAIRGVWFSAAKYLPEAIRNEIYRALRDIPSIVLGIVIVVVGIVMVKGKKKELDQWEKIETAKIEEKENESDCK